MAPNTQKNEENAVRCVLALIWLAIGALSLGIYPVESSLQLLARAGLHDDAARAALYLGASLDIFLGMATLLMPHRRLWIFQATVIVAYTLIITMTMPEFWLHPFGPILKNLAVLTLIWLLYRHNGAET